MAITILQILTWCRAPAITRAPVTNALMPGGLDDLGDFTTEEIREAVKSFARLPANPFLLSPHTLKRLTQLTLWVKDAQRLDEPVSFPNATTQAQFTAEIDAAQGRERIRKERQKTAESLASVRIVPPLTTSAGWESWSVSVTATLTLVYGSKGVPLAYVTRPDNIILDGSETWEQRAIATAPHTGLEYQADKMTVHLFYLNNISEESDAYTYVQPLLRHNDGRRDDIALQERYENAATVQTRVNEANRVWDMLTYKNERAMSFEEFQKKFQKALQHFAKAGRPKHDADIVDWIWNHIQNADLSGTVRALKASQGLNPRTPSQILQEIAKEVPNLSKATISPRSVSQLGTTFNEMELSELKTDNNEEYTFDGATPQTGAFTPDGKLFCGGYSHSQWFSSEMDPHRASIMELRDQNPELRPSARRRGGGGGKDKDKPSPRKRNQGQKHRLKIKELKAQYSELERKLAEVKADGDTEAKGSNAGNAFGGRASMAKKPD
jgi:hypothetical protein